MEAATTSAARMQATIDNRMAKTKGANLATPYGRLLTTSLPSVSRLQKVSSVLVRSHGSNKPVHTQTSPFVLVIKARFDRDAFNLIPILGRI